MSSRGGNNNNPAISINVEQFIQDIECRPAIWNRNYHCNKQFLELTWIELSKLYNLPCQTLKAKWKGLRDNFRVEYKRIPRDENGEMVINPEYYESKWAHYKPLLYLVEHMRHRSNKSIDQKNLSNILIENAAQDNEECVVEPDLAHGLVHNDYTSDGQNDDCDIDDECKNVSQLTSPSSSQNFNNNNINNGNMYPLKRKLDRIDNDTGIVLDIIKTEPAECHELRKSVNSKNNTNTKCRQNRSNSNRTNSNRSQNQQQQHQQQQQNGIDNLTNQRNNISNDINIISPGSISVASSQIEKPTTMIATSSTVHKNNLYNDREDDDYHYLMSLHPYMNKLQPSQKLRVRTKIQKLILKELYKEDLD